MRATKATRHVVNNTSPTASNAIGRKLARRSRIELKYAADMIKGGRKRIKTISGSIVIVGKPGMRLSASPRLPAKLGRAVGACALSQRAIARRRRVRGLFLRYSRVIGPCLVRVSGAGIAMRTGTGPHT